MVSVFGASFTLLRWFLCCFFPSPFLPPVLLYFYKLLAARFFSSRITFTFRLEITLVCVRIRSRHCCDRILLDFGGMLKSNYSFSCRNEGRFTLDYTGIQTGHITCGLKVNYVILKYCLINLIPIPQIYTPYS